MADLWLPNNSYIPFDPAVHSIADVCDMRKNQFLPYVRKYSTLTNRELSRILAAAKTFRWQALDLSCCKLASLPSQLWELPDLRILYLGNNRFGLDSNEQHINSISVIPRTIERLHNLQVLSIQGLSCSIEGDSPYNLPSLLYLDIFNCGFTQIPKALLIPSLESVGFNCRGRQLSSDVLLLKNLKQLYLSRSSIKSLPAKIGSLQKLERLGLQRTGISSLPTSIGDIGTLSDLDLSGTPLSKSLPPEILKQSAQEIIHFVLNQQSDKPKEYFNESKMLIVGQGSVGKTCLLNRIIHNKYIENPSTDGIDISKWEYQWNNETIRLNIWDFGGQEIYHATHQFFLTRRSLYVLVWDALAEEEYGRVEYWLNTIRSFANDSPIIIVVNKCDNKKWRTEAIKEKKYKKKFSQQIKNTLYVSCKDGSNIQELKQLVMETAGTLPLMKMNWLSSWMNVRKRIEKEAKNNPYISISSFLSICKEYCITEESEAISLIKYLHDLGIVLYYYNEPLLKNLVILSSKWGTKAVYAILNEKEGILKGKNGILSINDLPSIWKDRTKYPRECYPYLLSLMEHFQLAFRLDNETYLVAELLNNESIELEYSFDRVNTLSFRYEYDFLPAGIFTRLIVSANHYLETRAGIKQCWKRGAYLSYKSAFALIRLFDDSPNRYIQIDVNSKNSRERRELLSIIRSKLDEINEQFYNIEIKQIVPCCCSNDCKFKFDYNSLLKAEQIGRTEVPCFESWKKVPLSRILDGIEEKTTREAHQVPISNYFYETTSQEHETPEKTINFGDDLSMYTTINHQLVSWANTSVVFKAVYGKVDQQRLEKALCSDETDRTINSYELMKEVWTNHPEWGLMPNYKMLSTFEHSGKFYQKYRDHMAHMFKVFLLGLYLYETSDVVSNAFSNNNYDLSSFIAVWSITALYHDIGYVFDTLDSKIDSKTTEMVCGELIKTLQSPLSLLFPDQFTKSYEKRIQNEYRPYVRTDLVFADFKRYLDVFNGFGCSVGLCESDSPEINPIKIIFNMSSEPNMKRSNYDHGINSAMMLLLMQEYLCEYITDLFNNITNKTTSDDKPTFINEDRFNKIKEIYSYRETMSSFSKESAKALAIHNIDCDLTPIFIDNLTSEGVLIEFFRISLVKEPFAYLLRICDELQCWDRPYSASALSTGTYLKGKSVQLTKKNGHSALFIDDLKEKEKIRAALEKIVEPPIDEWLE